MFMKYKIGLIFLVFYFLSSGIFAKETVNETSTDIDKLEYTLPEVIVKGDNSMHALKMGVIRAEELKFEVFNNLNSTDDFDITCDWSAPTGTLIKYWRCDVEYMRKAREEAITKAMELGLVGPMISESQLAIENAHKTRALNKEMKALAVQYPEMAIAMINAHEMQQLYRDERRKRYKNSLLVGEPPEPKLVINKFTIWEAAFQDHKNGVISEGIWKRWDSFYRKIFNIGSYRALWKSSDHNKYGTEFVAYVNKVVSGQR